MEACVCFPLHFVHAPFPLAGFAPYPFTVIHLSLEYSYMLSPMCLPSESPNSGLDLGNPKTALFLTPPSYLMELRVTLTTVPCAGQRHSASVTGTVFFPTPGQNSSSSTRSSPALAHILHPPTSTLWGSLNNYFFSLLLILPGLWALPNCLVLTKFLIRRELETWRGSWTFYREGNCGGEGGRRVGRVLPAGRSGRGA